MTSNNVSVNFQSSRFQATQIHFYPFLKSCLHQSSYIPVNFIKRIAPDQSGNIHINIDMGSHQGNHFFDHRIAGVHYPDFSPGGGQVSLPEGMDSPGRPRNLAE
jgi:hypothetical protein